MTLYCRACNCNHYFKPGEVERIVYTLSAGAMDARCADNGSDRFDAGKDPYTVDHQCLRDVVGDSWDGEAYGEWVGGEVEARRHHAGVPASRAER